MRDDEELTADIDGRHWHPASSQLITSEPARGRSRRPRSIAEQIADDIGAEIMDGLFGANQRVTEQELAARYKLSRGPVREAIRILERRGLVEFFPRRGAFAVQHSLDLIADIFNVKAVHMGLVARCFTRSATSAGFADVEAEIAVLREMNAKRSLDVIDFTFQNARISAALRRHCGNEHLRRLTHASIDEAFWDFMWRKQPLDYLTRVRRARGVVQWEEIIDAARRGDDFEAERLGQQVLFDSRDNVLTVLKKTRNERVSKSRLLTNARKT
jgi:DNA-binding GntR family transcriptional regulator